MEKTKADDPIDKYETRNRMCPRTLSHTSANNGRKIPKKGALL